MVMATVRPQKHREYRNYTALRGGGLQQPYYGGQKIMKFRSTKVVFLMCENNTEKRKKTR